MCCLFVCMYVRTYLTPASERQASGCGMPARVNEKDGYLRHPMCMCVCGLCMYLCICFMYVCMYVSWRRRARGRPGNSFGFANDSSSATSAQVRLTPLTPLTLGPSGIYLGAPAGCGDARPRCGDYIYIYIRGCGIPARANGKDGCVNPS